MRIQHLVLVAVLMFTAGFGGKRGATSEIPEKREFPVSTSVSACQNFFEYACNEAIAGFKLREDRSRHIFAFNDSAERLLNAKKDYLDSLGSAKTNSPRTQQLSNVFQACMDEKASAGEEKKLVAEELAKLDAVHTREDFLRFLSGQVGTENFSFVDFGTTENLDDSDWNDVYFLADLQTLPEKSYYNKPEVTADLEKLATKFFQTIGWDKPEARAKWVVDFESRFSKSYPTPAEFRELFNKKTSITREKLGKDYPALQLAGFLGKIPKKTLIRNLTPENFAFVNKSLENEPLDVLKSVYAFHSLPGLLDDAYPEYFQASFDFSRDHLGGPNARPVRQERCTMYIMGKFTKEIDAEMLPKLFPNFPEKKFTELVEKVRASIIQGIRSNTWLSDKSKTAAIEKVRVAKLQLVQPRNDAEWDFNPPATYNPKTPYENDKLLDRNRIAKEIKELSERRDRNRWHMGPLTVNAYYNPSDNKFVLPIGILQYPFYDASLPDSTNLGAVGMVVGHELGHGVDDQGARYDKRGRLFQWMPDKDVKEFVKRGEKLVDQFNKIGHDGKLTLGENIGDLVGLTFAYRAAFPNNQGTEQAKRDFYTQYARTWCGVIRPKMREALLKTDPHSAIEARVNEQVKHQAAFEEAFGCKAGDPMTLPAKDRVVIW
ncbi:M13 family metallopeptidase [bacterium]|nr:M13 family metallopeptidase [bacterium]